MPSARGGRCPTSHTRVLCLPLDVGLGDEELWAPGAVHTVGSPSWATKVSGTQQGQRQPRLQGHSQRQAGDAAEVGSREGQDPEAPASPALLLSVIRFPLPANRPPPASPALKPQISARQRLQIVEIKSARGCSRAQGAEPGMGRGAGPGVAVRRDPRSATSPLRCPRRAGGGGVRRAAGRADADSERTFCSGKCR